MRQACQSNRLIQSGSPVIAEIEIGWVPGTVFMRGILFSEAHWTPEQALLLASLLEQSALKAMKPSEATERGSE